MWSTQGFLFLSAICLGLAARPYLNTFRRKAWGLALIGSGFGLLFAAHNASRLAGSSAADQAAVFAFSLGVTAIMIALAMLTMWFAHRRRAM
jgi:hypothetical protein